MACMVMAYIVMACMVMARLADVSQREDVHASVHACVHASCHATPRHILSRLGHQDIGVRCGHGMDTCDTKTHGL